MDGRRRLGKIALINSVFLFCLAVFLFSIHGWIGAGIDAGSAIIWAYIAGRQYGQTGG